MDSNITMTELNNTYHSIFLSSEFCRQLCEAANLDKIQKEKVTEFCRQFSGAGGLDKFHQEAFASFCRRLSEPPEVDKSKKESLGTSEQFPTEVNFSPTIKNVKKFDDLELSYTSEGSSSVITYSDEISDDESEDRGEGTINIKPSSEKRTSKHNVRNKKKVNFLMKMLSKIGGDKNNETDIKRRNFRSSINMDNQDPPTFGEYQAMEKCLIQTKIDLALAKEELDRPDEKLNQTKSELDLLKEQFILLKSQILDQQAKMEPDANTGYQVAAGKAA